MSGSIKGRIRPKGERKDNTGTNTPGEALERGWLFNVRTPRRPKPKPKPEPQPPKPARLVKKGKP